jgi:hypothetical protein
MGKYDSLNHAFGLIPPPGNPGGDTEWKDIALDADRRRLTTHQLINELPPLVSGRDESTVRENRKRGRAAYQREAAIQAANAEMDSQVRGMEELRAARIRAVKRFNKKHGIRTMRRTKGSNIDN